MFVRLFSRRVSGSVCRLSDRQLDGMNVNEWICGWEVSCECVWICQCVSMGLSKVE